MYIVSPCASVGIVSPCASIGIVRPWASLYIGNVVGFERARWPESGARWPESGARWPESGARWHKSGTCFDSVLRMRHRASEQEFVSMPTLSALGPCTFG
eukprot:366367-Chlamydomonas_euryale.AAC.21